MKRLFASKATPSATWLFLLIVLFVSLASGCKKESLPVHSLTGKTMGTNYSVTVATAESLDLGELQSEIDNLLSGINQRMSTYDSNSLLSQFNSTDSTEWFDVTPDVASLVSVAHRVSKDTSGAYDVTLGTVVDLWGFGPDMSKTEKPPMDQILDELYNVGHQLLVVSRDQRQLRKLVPKLKVDLSSIAKGHAVDEIGSLLEKRGLQRYVVEIGGELRTRGLSANHKPWTIAIESPDSSVNPGSFNAIVVENSHIATSGDYRNYREVDGVRYSHIIDGRSGYPIEHNLASVTVMHGSTMQADAWATAFMVLGPDETLAIAESRGLAVSMVLREGENFVTRHSTAFEAYLSK